MSTKTFEVIGPISEHADFLKFPVQANEIVELNLSKMTFINSVGVKNWILWGDKIPSSSQVKLKFCPFVIISQARTVHGFLPKNFFVESFYAPYACESCNAEKIMFFERGKDFQYSDGATPLTATLPEEIPCEKCKEKMEPDFILKNALSFLR